MTRDTLARRWPIWGLLTLAAVALLRLASLGQLALTDNTESRYGSIALQMARSGDWITPRTYVQGDLVPFWGKPPLQFWLTAASYRALGISEFSARLASFLVAIVTVAATVLFAAGLWGKRVGILSGIVLSTSGAVLVLSGACELDMSLAASISGAMIAFALFARRTGWPRKAWGLALFLALAVGALAKGPVALVLAGLAVGLWLLLSGRWRLLVELPWISGLALFLAVAAPWYILAERATPGFLNYFLLHENLLRYLVNEYGDLYGYGRLRPYGTIWLMFLGVFLPWTVVATAALVRPILPVLSEVRRAFRWTDPRPALSMLVFRLRKFGRVDPWLAYVLIWGLVPPLFFTLARQVVWTYVLPGLPGLAIATAVVLERWMQSDAAADLLKLLKWHVVAIGGLGVAAAVTAATFPGGSLRPGPGRRARGCGLDRLVDRRLRLARPGGRAAAGHRRVDCHRRANLGGHLHRGRVPSGFLGR